MKTSVADNNGWKCPKCDGKTSQDIKGKGFVRHLERFRPKDSKVPTSPGNKCKYGRKERDL